MEKTFEEFLNVEDRIGKMLICGLEGYGKTLLLSYIAVEKMLIGQKECWKSWDVIDKYNQLGYNFSKDFEHLVFVAFISVNCAGTKIPTRVSYDLDPFRMGLYDNDFDTDIYPPYSTLFIPEAQTVFNSYRQNAMRSAFFRYFETSRQARLSLVLDCQRPILIAKNVRDLVNRFIILTKPVEHLKNDKGEVIGHKLFIVEFKSNVALEAWIKTGNKVNGEEYTLVLNRKTFDNYDSYFFEYLHLKGREDQDFRIVERNSVTSVDDVEELIGMEAPEGFYKTSCKKITENTLEEDNEEYDF